LVRLDREGAQRLTWANQPTSSFPLPAFQRYARYGRINFLPPGRPKVKVPPPPKLGSAFSGFVVRGEEVALQSHSRGLVASAGRVDSEETGLSIILAGGPVLLNRGSRLVVVADGDVELPKGMGVSVIVTRGSVRSHDLMAGCLVLAGGQ